MTNQIVNECTNSIPKFLRLFIQLLQRFSEAVRYLNIAALQFAQKGVRVNAVCPGVIRTPMIERFTGGNPEVEAQFTAGEPIGRLGESKEIADAVVWLCSDEASFVTGAAIPVDGGWVAP